MIHCWNALECVLLVFPAFWGMVVHSSQWHCSLHALHQNLWHITACVLEKVAHAVFPPSFARTQAAGQDVLRQLIVLQHLLQSDYLSSIGQLFHKGKQ